jgi:hydrogenase small subunit
MPALPETSPAQRLLDVLGPIDELPDYPDVGDYGMPTRRPSEAVLEEAAWSHEHTRLGRLKRVHVFSFAGMSCDG